jgi:1-acyl-sn-glycerol-3-phosphate acyltransferase
MRTFWLGMNRKMFAAVVRDMADSAGLRLAAARAAGWLLFAFPALRFSYQMGRFDREVHLRGLRAAARRLLSRYYAGGDGPALEVPAAGPVLIVANHPGMGDALTLFSAISRTDLYVAVKERDFFRAMPGLARSLIVIPETAAGRLAAIRRMVEVLAGGHALVLFPAGAIEPDPAGDQKILKPWSSLAGALLRASGRRSAGCAVVPVVLSNLLNRRTANTLLARTRRDPEARAQLAALLDLLLRRTRRQSPRPKSREPQLFGAAELAGSSAEELTSRVRESMQALLPGSSGQIPSQA